MPSKNNQRIVGFVAKKLWDIRKERAQRDSNIDKDESQLIAYSKIDLSRP